jgi:hypothetical protein
MSEETLNSNESTSQEDGNVDLNTANHLAKLKALLEVTKIEKEIEKLGKEAEKVEFELSDLRRPWWKRPPLIAAFLPTLLAIGTLLIASANGWFQVETKRLENRKWDLDRSVDTLEKKTSTLELERANLASRQKKMQTRFTIDSTQIEGERKEMRQRLDSVALATTEAKHMSSKALTEVIQTRAQAKREVAKLEKAANKADSLSFVGYFKSIEKPVQQAYDRDRRTSPSALIQVLKANDGRAKRLRRQLEKKANNILLEEDIRGIYYYTLFKGTGEPIWRAKFLSTAQAMVDAMIMSDNNPSSYENTPVYFETFNASDWSPAEKDDFALFLTKAMKSLPANPKLQGRLLFNFYRLLGEKERTPGIDFCTKHPEQFIYLLQLAKKIFFSADDKLKDITPLYSRTWLRTFAPSALVAYCALFFANNSASDNALLYDNFNEIRYAIQRIGLKEGDYPSSPDKAQWQMWLANHPKTQFWDSNDLSVSKPEELEKRLYAPL